MEHLFSNSFHVLDTPNCKVFLVNDDEVCMCRKKGRLSDLHDLLLLLKEPSDNFLINDKKNDKKLSEYVSIEDVEYLISEYTEHARIAKTSDYSERIIDRQSEKFKQLDKLTYDLIYCIYQSYLLESLVCKNVTLVEFNPFGCTFKTATNYAGSAEVFSFSIIDELNRIDDGAHDSFKLYTYTINHNSVTREKVFGRDALAKAMDYDCDVDQVEFERECHRIIRKVDGIEAGIVSIQKQIKQYKQLVK